MKTQASELEHSSQSISHSARRQPGAALLSMLSFGLASMLFVSGCNKAPAPAPAAEPAPAPTASAAPPPAAAAPAPPPAAAPAPAPMAAMAPLPPPPPRQYTVAAGTRLAVRIQQTISAKASNVGDSFSGTLAQPVVVQGVTVMRAGVPVTGTVTAAKDPGRFKGGGELAVSLSKVGGYSVETAPYGTTANGKGKRTAGFVGGGGGGGALIGGLAGGGKGALIGGLLGAGAGTAGAALTGNKDITLPAETVVTFSLTSPVTVTKQKAP